MEAHGINDIGQQFLECWQVEIVPDAANGAPYIGGNEVEDLARGRREAANHQITRQQQNGRVNADLHITEIGVEPVQFTVPADHFIIDRGQLFVGGLQFFFRSLQLLVDTLQFFVGALHLFAGRLEFLVRRFVLLLYGLQIVARLGQFALEFRHAACHFALADRHLWC